MLNNNIVIVGVLEKLISFGLYLITATLLVNHIFWRCKETPLRLHCPKKVLPSDKAQQQAFYSKVNSINNSKWELGFYLKCKSTPKNRFPIKFKLPNAQCSKIARIFPFECQVKLIVYFYTGT